jgi:hypothetical protein
MSIVSSFGARARALADERQEPFPIERSTISAADSERRRHDRISITLRGRYMLECGREYPCVTRDVSRIGMAIEGVPVGAIGERVVAYLEELGRIEGKVVRRSKGWFAIELVATPQRLELLDEKISAIARRRACDEFECKRHEKSTAGYGRSMRHA